MERESKTYSCGTCRVDFCFTIEPGKEDAAVRQNYPESLEWLKDLDEETIHCPVCGEQCST